MSSPDQDPKEAISRADEEVIDVRRGMFGAEGSGDTSGYGRLVREVLLPGSSPRPYGGYFDEVVDGLAAALIKDNVEFTDAIEKVVVYRDELTLHVRRDALEQVAHRLRDDPQLRFEMCLGVSGVHYPHETERELHAVPEQRVAHDAPSRNARRVPARRQLLYGGMTYQRTSNTAHATAPAATQKASARSQSGMRRPSSCSTAARRRVRAR